MRITRIRGGKERHGNEKCPNKQLFCGKLLKMIKHDNFFDLSVNKDKVITARGWGGAERADREGVVGKHFCSK